MGGSLVRTCEKCIYYDPEVDECWLDPDKTGPIPYGADGPHGDRCQQHSDKPRTDASEDVAEAVGDEFP